MSSPSPRRWRRLLLGFAVLAVLGFLAFAALAASWTTITTVGPEAAAERFAAERLRLGPAPPYLDWDEADQPFLHHELEQKDSPPIRHVVALVWEPDEQLLIEVRLPTWFLRAKDGSGGGLGLLFSAATRDFEALELQLDLADLKRRGPGLLCDTTMNDGSWVMAWSEP